MQLAVALHCQNDADAERAVNGVSSADQRDFAAQRDGTIIMRKAEQTIVQSLPEAFRPRFRQMLAKYWDTLNETAESATFSLPRTSDGRTRTIHVPIKQFHQLRHSAASVLQEMNQVEAHPMMRLAYLEQSRRTEAVVMTTGSGTTSSVP
ncbi:hypothetical protein GQ600_26778 [Phytophthora cactorum]|nr:hypothetical protein GQ600_26778 [Phytophthora cactorum]